jgi:hypothetical protein
MNCVIWQLENGISFYNLNILPLETSVALTAIFDSPAARSPIVIHSVNVSFIYRKALKLGSVRSE